MSLNLFKEAAFLIISNYVTIIKSNIDFKKKKETPTKIKIAKKTTLEIFYFQIVFICFLFLNDFKICIEILFIFITVTFLKMNFYSIVLTQAFCVLPM